MTYEWVKVYAIKRIVITIVNCVYYFHAITCKIYSVDIKIKKNDFKY